MGCDEKKLEELNLEKVTFEIFVQNATLSPRPAWRNQTGERAVTSSLMELPTHGIAKRLAVQSVVITE